MKFRKVDHVGVIVNDLSAAKEFFLEFGLEVKGEWGHWGQEKCPKLVGQKTCPQCPILII
ncbi:Glyoxalase/fosfomycin resistance/dioxygenase domain-containing protein OS=Ureibacillus acetophenoni OX=614649 GN=SAMN05877842_110154 PE=4 SV=1 [Ureibacillus acetophenoni]